MPKRASEYPQNLWCYLKDAGLALWGLFMVSVVGTAGSVINLGLVDSVPLWCWVTALVICLVLAPTRAYHKQQVRHNAEKRKLKEAKRALWYYCKLRAMESEVRSVMKRLPSGVKRGDDVYKNFIHEHLAPWVEELQLFSSGTSWEKTELGNSIAENDPGPDYNSILRFINNRSDWLECVHDKYKIMDEHDV